MGDLMTALRRTVRQLARRPVINGLAVLSLALGIGVNSSIFSVVNAVLLRDPPVSKPETLVEVYTGDSGGFPYATSSYPDYVDVRNGVEAFSDLAAFNLAIASYDEDQVPRLLFGEIVTGNFFDLLGVELALGRSFLPEEDATPGSHPVAILGHGFWQAEMGADPEVLGKTVKLNGIIFSIVGVAPEEYRGTLPSLVADFWVPMQMHDALNERSLLDRRGRRSLFMKGRLAPGVTVEQAKARLEAMASVLSEEYPETNEDRTMTIVPSREVVFNPGVDGPLFGVAGLLLTMVGLVLLIACSNIANLLLARAADRRKEVAIRLALGASRRQLMGQLLFEGMALASLGGILGLGLAFWISRLVVSFQPPLPIPLAVDLGLDSKVLIFTLVLTVVTGLVSGLAPALRASKPDLVPSLRDDSSGGGLVRRRFGLGNGLVVLQVVVSTVLLLGAGLFLRSLAKTQAVEPGFDLRNGAVAMVSLGFGNRYSEEEGRLFYERLVERVGSLPGSRSAALAGHLPLGFAVTSRGVETEDEPLEAGEDGQQVDTVRVSSGYFETMGIDLPWGRSFRERDGPGAPGVVIVIEEAARRFWPGEDPVGKRLRWSSSDPYMEVVGVAKTGKYRTLGEEPRPFVYEPFRQSYSSTMSLVVASSLPEAEVLGMVREELKALDPALPIFDLRTMTEHLAFMLFPARMGAVLLAAFGLLGLILASVGLYGVVAYGVSRRTREVGIRRALGAQRRDVLWLVVREGMLMVVIGIALGVGIALLAGKVLQGWLYGIGAADPVTFVAVPAVLAAIAFLANLIPARRATRVDPMMALRYE